jgi:hypothetical protein
MKRALSSSLTVSRKFLHFAEKCGACAEKSGYATQWSLAEVLVDSDRVSFTGRAALLAAVARHYTGSGRLSSCEIFLRKLCL